MNLSDSETMAGLLKGAGFELVNKVEDAELVMVGLGSTMGTARTVVDKLRESGLKAGLLKIRSFRPFPVEDIVEALKDKKAVAVMDRADSFNAVSGPLYSEVKACLYNRTQVPVVDYIYGLGGRDVTLENLETVFTDLSEIAGTSNIENKVTYLGVRE